MLVPEEIADLTRTSARELEEVITYLKDIEVFMPHNDRNIYMEEKLKSVLQRIWSIEHQYCKREEDIMKKLDKIKASV